MDLLQASEFMKQETKLSQAASPAWRVAFSLRVHGRSQTPCLPVVQLKPRPTGQVQITRLLRLADRRRRCDLDAQKVKWRETLLISGTESVMSCVVAISYLLLSFLSIFVPLPRQRNA